MAEESPEEKKEKAVLESNVDAAAWSIELERVAPKLKLKVFSGLPSCCAALLPTHASGGMHV